MNYKYNESKYAEEIYKNGFQTKYIPTELRLLVLYYRDVLGLKPQIREQKINEFCKKYIPGFKKEKYFKTINRALKEGLKKEQKFIDIDEISIYQGEINYINSLDIKYEYKKVMFAFLVQLKLNKTVYEYKYNKEYNSIYFKGGRKQYNNIKKISKINNKISINDEIINELYKLKLVTVLHKGIIILDCLNNCIQEGEVVIKVKDYESIGFYFDLYNGIKGIIKCENCNNPIRMTAKYQKYCKQCAKDIEKENWKKRKRKQRNKTKCHEDERS